MVTRYTCTVENKDDFLLLSTRDTYNGYFPGQLRYRACVVEGSTGERVKAFLRVLVPISYMVYQNKKLLLIDRKSDIGFHLQLLFSNCGDLERSSSRSFISNG
jgi:hypothetical protein